MTKQLTPLQDILRYAYEQHGMEYAFALYAATKIACAEPSSVEGICGSFAVKGLEKLKLEIEAEQVR